MNLFVFIVCCLFILRNCSCYDERVRQDKVNSFDATTGNDFIERLNSRVVLLEERDQLQQQMIAKMADIIDDQATKLAMIMRLEHSNGQQNSETVSLHTQMQGMSDRLSKQSKSIEEIKADQSNKGIKIAKLNVKLSIHERTIQNMLHAFTNQCAIGSTRTATATEVVATEIKDTSEVKTINTIKDNVFDSSNLPIKKAKTYESSRVSSTISMQLPSDRHETPFTPERQPRHHINARIRRLTANVRVAFFASMTSNNENLGAHQNLHFPNVETNIGNAYNSHHGVFIAPISGTYVFFATITMDNKHNSWAAVSVNGQTKAGMFVVGSGDQGSQTVIVHLIKGGDVAIVNVGNWGYYWGEAHSTFAGFLLYPDDSEEIVVG